MFLPADLRVGEALYVVLAGPRSASSLGLPVVVAVVCLAVGARRAVLELGAGVTVAVVGLRLQSTSTTSVSISPTPNHSLNVKGTVSPFLLSWTI